MGSVGSTISRPSTRSDYKLTRNDISNLIAMFEGYTAGTGVSIYNKLVKAEQEGRTNVYLNFTEKDFAGYKLENMMLPQNEVVSLEKIMKQSWKESFDSYWEERRRTRR